jgi:hypothetical protein
MLLSRRFRPALVCLMRVCAVVLFAQSLVASGQAQDISFLGPTSREFLYEGTMIDRFGGTDYSRFFSPAGTPAAGRALPPRNRRPISQNVSSHEAVRGRIGNCRACVWGRIWDAVQNSGPT